MSKQCCTWIENKDEIDREYTPGFQTCYYWLKERIRMAVTVMTGRAGL